MDHLTILSLGRNLIKKIENLDGVADTLEELWISYNLIDKLTNIEKLTKLRILYISNNKACVICPTLSTDLIVSSCPAPRLISPTRFARLQIASWGEIEKLQALENLEDLLLVGNPIWEASGPDQTKLKSPWRIEVRSCSPLDTLFYCTFVFVCCTRFTFKACPHIDRMWLAHQNTSIPDRCLSDCPTSRRSTVCQWMSRRKIWLRRARRIRVHTMPTCSDGEAPVHSCRVWASTWEAQGPS
eukprot:1177313-Prorocentrum_minimum.AAC.5